MSVDRRTFLSRLAGAAASVLGALGLSCRPREATSEPAEPAAPPPVPATPETEPLPDELKGLVATKEWPALKKVWQEMTRHADRQVRDEEAFKSLKPPMQEALAALKLQAAGLRVQPKIMEALQAVAERRYGHIYGSVYPHATCYEMTRLGGAVQSSQDRLEKQYAVLAQLVEKERIKPEVADKARQLIARQIEFQAQAERLWKEQAYQREEELVKVFDWETHEVKPDFAVSEPSQQVAKLILELCRP
jgi:hypothetical protein